MLTSMCSALIDTASPAPANTSDQGLTDSPALVKAVADADASVDVSSVITQYLGPNQPPAKWQQVCRGLG